MAKQTGLYNIRGKVNGYSYYKQTGVNDTIIRRINEGMSARVKDDEGYANTRLNNQEFGFACKIAGIYGKMISPKFRPMVLPFSQSNMAKTLLDIIKKDPAAGAQWGWRTIPTAEGELPLAPLNAQAKIPFSNYVSDFEAAWEPTNPAQMNVDCTINWQAGLSELLATIGANGVRVRTLVWEVVIRDPNKTALTQGSIEVRSSAVDNFNEDDFSEASVFQVPARRILNPPTGVSVSKVAVFVLMPYRTIGGTEHILQEACTFAAVDMKEE